jgi:hypothetical protein
MPSYGTDPRCPPFPASSPRACGGVGSRASQQPQLPPRLPAFPSDGVEVVGPGMLVASRHSPDAAYLPPLLGLSAEKQLAGVLVT